MTDLPKLEKPGKLSEDDILKLIGGMDQIVGSQNRGLGQVTMRVALEQVRAINEFNASSTALTKRIYWLTWALVALTVVITGFTVLLWWRGV